MLKLCKKLNIASTAGGDYRYLAGHFGMSSDDIHLISRKENPTNEVLKWVGGIPQNTAAKLRETLVKMKRYDCVKIIDEKYKCVGTQEEGAPSEKIAMAEGKPLHDSCNLHCAYNFCVLPNFYLT